MQFSFPGRMERRLRMMFHTSLRHCPGNNINFRPWCLFSNKCTIKYTNALIFNLYKCILSILASREISYFYLFQLTIFHEGHSCHAPDALSISTPYSINQGIVPSLIRLVGDLFGKEAERETNIGDTKHVNQHINQYGRLTGWCVPCTK